MHIVAANTDHFSNPKKYYGIQLQDLFHIEELFSLHYFEYMSTFSFPGESHDFWEFVCVGCLPESLQKQEVFWKDGWTIPIRHPCRSEKIHPLSVVSLSAFI